MTVLDIARIGNPILRQRAHEVVLDELAGPDTQRFIDDLVETMHAANGAGLAAPQVGRSLRICAIEVQKNPRYPYFPDIPLTIVVNPVVRPIGDETFDNYEGCLSVPDLRGLVSRFAEVEVRYFDRMGVAETRVMRGLAAAVFQHEIDHLDGALFVDKVTDPRSLTTWADFKRFHEQAFLDRIIPFARAKGA